MFTKHKLLSESKSLICHNFQPHHNVFISKCYAFMPPEQYFAKCSSTICASYKKPDLLVLTSDGPREIILLSLLQAIFVFLSFSLKTSTHFNNSPISKAISKVDTK